MFAHVLMMTMYDGDRMSRIECKLITNSLINIHCGGKIEEGVLV